MRKRPRDPKAALFSPAIIGWSIFQGAWVFLLTAAVFAEAISRRLPDSETRALAFVSLVTCNLLLIFVNRSFSSSLIIALRRPNSALWVVLAATAILLAVSLGVPPVRTLFAFGPMSAADFARVLVAGIATIGLLEFIKAIPLSRRLAPT